MWNRRELLRTTGLGLTALALPRALSPGSAPTRPNVLYVLADQWRASATGYAGDANVKTPNLDRLAGESIHFVNAVSVCPVCTPYRAALMTGRYPTSTGMFLNDLYLPDEELCMGELFRRAGYDTAYIGKWHLDGHGRSSYIPPRRRQGFDYWKTAECDHNYNHSHYYAGTSPEKRFWDGYDAFAQTRDAREYLRARAGADKPFLLMVSYGTPHFPHHTAPPEYRKQYPPSSIKLPPNVPERLAERARREACGYYAHCAALDRCVGDLLGTLNETRLADNTLVVFTSDHGEMLGSQGQPPCEKQRPWDESVRVPLLLRCPALHGRRGRRVRTPINTPDILPTLLSLAGVPVPKSVEGESLAGLVRGQGERDRAALIMSVSPFAGYHRGKEFRGVRTARHTYVRDLEGPWLLYDNDRDPHQLNNLADRPEHAALRSRLDGRLQAELKRIGDDFRPRRHYLARWAYEVNRTGCIPYHGRHKVQSPAVRKRAASG